MIDLRYSLMIEATEDPSFFTFYSPDLEGFTGVGHSVEDCLYKAKFGMEEHVALLKVRGLPVPTKHPNPTVTIKNAKLAAISQDVCNLTSQKLDEDMAEESARDHLLLSWFITEQEYSLRGERKA